MNDERLDSLRKVQAKLKGQTAELPTRVSGREVRRTMSVPQDRIIVLRPASGGLVRQIKDNQIVEINPGDELDDVPLGRWGGGVKCTKSAS
jgi:hypothetical protein